MRKFFSNVWVKCISVLLAIILVSGGLIAILSDLLYVSPEERTGRALKKIYGEEKTYQTVLDVDGTDEDKKTALNYDKGKIEKIFFIDKENDSDTEYDILFRSTGNEGYKFGTVTLWIRVSVKDGVSKISKVILDSYTKQTLMGKLGSEYYGAFLVDITDEYFTADKDADGIKNTVSGATKSATAGVNAVNCVINYVNGSFGG